GDWTIGRWQPPADRRGFGPPDRSSGRWPSLSRLTFLAVSSLHSESGAGADRWRRSPLTPLTAARRLGGSARTARLCFGGPPGAAPRGGLPVPVRPPSGAPTPHRGGRPSPGSRFRDKRNPVPTDPAGGEGVACACASLPARYGR